MKQKLPHLAIAYLKATNSYYAWLSGDDDATRAMLEARALAAAEAVDREFAALIAAGRLKSLTGAYRKARLAAVAAGRHTKPWGAVVMEHKKRMIGAYASEQMRRARSGATAEPNPKAITAA